MFPMPHTYILVLVYLALISFAAIGITLLDKRSAKRGAGRVRERTLLLVAALGGSVAMLFAMRGARHKTQRAKFMLGIPLIIALQIGLGVLIWRWV